MSNKIEEQNEKYQPFHDEQEHNSLGKNSQQSDKNPNKNLQSSQDLKNQNQTTQANNSLEDIEKQQEQEAQFMEHLFSKFEELIGKDQTTRLQKMLEQIPPEEFQKLGGSMGSMSMEQLDTQLSFFQGQTAEQVFQAFEEMIHMKPGELEAMQEQLTHTDEADIIASKAFMDIEAEMQYYGKPWRYLNEYGFYGFSVHTFTFAYVIFTTFVYTYVQGLFYADIKDEQCQIVKAGGMLPYLVKEQGQYFRLFTSFLVFGSWGHLFISTTNCMYIFFMIERPLGNWMKFAFVLALGHVGAVLNSLNFEGDVLIYGNAGAIVTTTVLSFYFCVRYRKLLLVNKFFLCLIGFYFFYYFYYVFFQNPEKVMFHLGGVIVGCLVQPFVMNMNYKLSETGRNIYKVLLVLYFVFQLAMTYFLPCNNGENTQNIVKKCGLPY